ncbi:MAG: ATP-dependent DNA ligase [Gemmatimonadota bacterium]|nr:ATP-dependent DNA ligase [Gemmatimonadota bacterium]
MEAKLVDVLPEGKQWQYEPKWDGFRCLAYRDGKTVDLRSKSGQPLGRYFPDVVEALLALGAQHFVLDGEIVVPMEGSLSFDELLLRIHPAASRVQKLSRERPALYIVFDLLVDPSGRSLVDRTLEERRHSLGAFATRWLGKGGAVRLSPATTSLATVRKWFRSIGNGLDGIIAKRLDLPYRSGDRTGMQKIKQIRSADCVVGGFRYASAAKVLGSLLLGLYDDDGLLHHVGFTSSFKTAERKALLARVEPLVKTPGFTGRAPGGPSRWSTKRSEEWQPLAPSLVVEVQYDHFTGGRFRHGTKLLRWRPDKAPRQCTIDQVESEGRSSLQLLTRSAQRRAAASRLAK